MSKYIIQPWSEIHPVECAALALKASGEKAWSLDEYASSFAEGHSGLVAVSNQEIIGCLIAQHIFETVDLLDIQVIPAHQGSGAAKLLLNALISACLESSVETIMLEVRCSNKRAIAFYRKSGFESIHIRKNYYASNGLLPAEDAEIMRYLL